MADAVDLQSASVMVARHPDTMKAVGSIPTRAIGDNEYG